jgi:hypothetical protein
MSGAVSSVVEIESRVVPYCGSTRFFFAQLRLVSAIPQANLEQSTSTVKVCLDAF